MSYLALALAFAAGVLAGLAFRRPPYIRYIVIDERPPHTHVGVGDCEEEARMALLRSRARVLDEYCEGK